MMKFIMIGSTGLNDWGLGTLSPSFAENPPKNHPALEREGPKVK